jgi:UDP-N-acetylmuramoyl-tripeptide--D-alanyl-D-alanine ligase
MNGGLTTGFVMEEMAARGYHVVSGEDVPVTGGAADSRSVRPGDLFTAFPGEHAEGDDFVPAAFAAGAVAAICSRAPADVPAGKTLVVAPDTTRAVSELAHAWRMVCNPRVVGITGTVGKTTAKELTAAALSARFRVHRSEGNMNSREGLPLALLDLRREHEVSVLEMGMDSPGEIVSLCEIARPEAGAVLNIGLTHAAKLGSIEAIEREKLSLPRWLPPSGTAILNADDPRVAAAVPGLRCRAITFGEAEEALLHRGAVEDRGLEGTSFDVSFGGETLPASVRVPGAHVVPGALAAMGACLALGMTLAEAVGALGAAEVQGRLHVLRGASGALILDDRYNSSPASLAGALELLRGLPGRRIAFLGHMAELGAYEEEAHREAGRVAARCCDVLVAIGDTCLPLVEEARAGGLAEVRWFATREEAAAHLAPLLREGDCVLVKASRGVALEAVLPLLEGHT